jgi:peptide/nickel transport system permease protein
MRHQTLVLGAGIVVALVLSAILAPLFTGDPVRLNPLVRLVPPSAAHAFGTDQFGRDILSRTLNGGRISLFVGFSVAVLATLCGLAIGILCGFYRTLDAVVMRVMDGLMAIPTILLAIALVALTSPGIANVIFAVTLAEVPRVVRLVRGIVLQVRQMTFVEAAVASGCSDLRVMVRHVLPSTFAPISVQATFICASAIMAEATLSFLGAGTPPEIPSWGNAIAEGRSYFQLAPWIVLIPGGFLAALILGINLFGDAMRDLLDPRMRRAL